MGRKSEIRLYNSLNNQFYLDEDNIKIRTEEYKAKFPEIDDRHIQFLVKYISSLTIESFNPAFYSTFQEKEYIARVITNVSNCTLEDRKKTPSTVNRLYWLNRKSEKVEQYLKENHLIPAQNPEIYLPLVNAITKGVVEIVGNTVINSITHVEKYSADQTPPRKRSSHSPEREERESWVKRVTIKNDVLSSSQK